MKGLKVQVGDNCGIVTEVNNNGDIILLLECGIFELHFEKAIERNDISIIHGHSDGRENHEEWARLACIHQSMLIQINHANDTLNHITLYRNYWGRRWGHVASKKINHDDKFQFWLIRRHHLLVNFHKTFGIDWNSYVTLCDKS